MRFIKNFNNFLMEDGSICIDMYHLTSFDRWKNENPALELEEISKPKKKMTVKEYKEKCLNLK